MADGTLLTVAQVKNYANIEHTGDDELLDDLIQEAEARLQGYLERPITSAEFTEHHDGGTSVLFLRRFPVDDTSFTITDTQGTEGTSDDETVESTKYRIYPERGEVWRTSTTGMRATWPAGRRRFKVVYTGGLDLHPDWSTFIEVELRGSLRDLVTEWYVNRSPGAASEREGAGIGRRTDEADRGIPLRVREVWDRYVNPLGV